MKYFRPKYGLITALDKELLALRTIFNEAKPRSKKKKGGGHLYYEATINLNNNHKCNIVFAKASEGNNRAAIRANNMLNDYKTIEHIIMVGIAAGVPNEDDIEKHVRLGDIVVSDEKGIIQYDYIKLRNYITRDEEIKLVSNRPDPKLLEYANYLETESKLNGINPWVKHINTACQQLNKKRPDEKTDILKRFEPEMKWKEYILQVCKIIEENHEITKKKITEQFKYKLIPKNHPDQENCGRIKGYPMIHFGPIASANIVLRDEILRDKLRRKHGIKAIEMESAGIVDATYSEGKYYFTIRGICDYANLDKNDNWQDYAAIVAAAYTRSLIEFIETINTNNYSIGNDNDEMNYQQYSYNTFINKNDNLNNHDDLQDIIRKYKIANDIIRLNKNKKKELNILLGIDIDKKKELFQAIGNAALGILVSSGNAKLDIHRLKEEIERILCSQDMIIKKIDNKIELSTYKKSDIKRKLIDHITDLIKQDIEDDLTDGILEIW